MIMTKRILYIHHGYGIGGADPRVATPERGAQLAEGMVEAIVAGVKERMGW